MRDIFDSSLAVLTALCLIAATIGFGAVTPDVATSYHGLALLLVLCWAAKVFFSKTVTWKFSPMHVPVLAFCVYAGLRHLACPLKYEGRLELFEIAFGAVIYFCAVSNFSRERERRILIWALMLLALVEVSYGLWQSGVKSDEVLWSARPEAFRGRASGTFICPNNLAGFLEMVLGLLIARAAMFHARGHSVERNVLLKTFVVYSVLMIIAGIIATFSRAGWVSTFLSLLVFLLWGDWRLRLSWPRVAVAIVAMAAMIVIAFNWAPVRRYISKTVSTGTDRMPISLKDPTIGTRTQLWAATAEMIRDNPIFGTGPGTWEWIHLKYQKPHMNDHADHAHNDILQLASDYGLIGFAIVLAAMICYFRHGRRMSRNDLPSEQRAFAVGSIVSMTAILFHSWFDFNLHIPGNALLFVIILAFTVAMDDPKSRYPRFELSRATRNILGAVLLLLCCAGAWVIVPATLARHLTNKGTLYKQSLEWEAAMNYYEEAIDWDPGYPQPFIRMGDIYRGKSQWLVDTNRAAERKELAEEAVHYYNDALSLNPYLSEVWLRRGRAKELAGDETNALKSYRRSIKVDPQNPFNWRMLGQYYRDRGDTNNATAAFYKSVELMPWPANFATYRSYRELQYGEQYPDK